MTFLLYYGIRIPEEELLESKKGIEDLFDRYAYITAREIHATIEGEVNQISAKITDIFCWVKRLYFHYVEFDQFSLHIPFLHTIKEIPQKELQAVMRDFQTQVESAKPFILEEEKFLKLHLLSTINKEFSETRWKPKFHLVIKDFNEVT